MGIKYYGYDEFARDLKILADKIDFPFEAIVAVARGGMSIAHLLGEYFDNRNVFTVNSIGYEDTKKLDSVRVFNVPDLAGFKKILIVDDMIDTGESMKKVVEVLKKKHPLIEFRVAVIFHKENTVFDADYFVQKTDDWIDFFWVVDLKGIKR